MRTQAAIPTPNQVNFVPKSNHSDASQPLTVFQLCFDGQKVFIFSSKARETNECFPGQHVDLCLMNILQSWISWMRLFTAVLVHAPSLVFLRRQWQTPMLLEQRLNRLTQKLATPIYY